MIRIVALSLVAAACFADDDISTLKKRAVDYVISNQKDDGSFKLPELGVDAQPFGIYAVAGLAIMSERGIADEVVKIANYFLGIQDEDGLFVKKGSGYHRASLQQGYCILFLEEILLRVKDKGFPFKKEEVEKIRAAIEKAIVYLKETQHETGTWTYDPRRKAQLGTYKESAVSVGIMHSLAMARKLGFDVDEGMMKKGVEYFISRQYKDGGFINGDWERTPSYHMTSGVMYAMKFFKRYDGVEESLKRAEAYVKTRDGKGYLTNNYPKDGFARRRVMYGHLYTCLYSKTDDDMAAETLSTMVLGSKDEGLWTSSISTVGATSFAILALNSHKNKLHIFEDYSVEPEETWY